MTPFLVLIGLKRQPPRLEFGCLAPDWSTCFMQHLDLAEVGERVEVLPARKALELWSVLSPEVV